MERAAAARAQWAEELGRQRHVTLFRRELCVELGALELVLLRLDRVLDRLPGGVQRHARLAVAHVAQRELQLALPSEVLDARLVEVGEARRSRDVVERPAL